MTSKQQQITHSAVYLIPVVVGNLVPIVTLPILTRVLSPEDFGAWALTNAYAVVLGGAAAVGLPIAFDRNFFECRTDRRRAELLYSVLAFSLLSFALCGALTWLWQEPITTWLLGESAYQNLLIGSFGATAVALLKGYYMTYLRNTEQAAAFSTFTIAERLLNAVLTVLFVAWFRIGALGLVLGQLLASLVVLLVIAARMLRTAPLSFSGPLLADSLKLGAPLMPRVLLGVVGNNVDKYLIGQVASLGGVGIYTIGQRVANIAFTYMTALQNVFGPRVYTMMFSGDPHAGTAIGRYLTSFAYASTVVAFLIALFSEEILTILAPGYVGSIPVVTILVLFYAIQFFGKMPQITYARKTYLVSILAAVSTGVSVACGAAGIWLFGTVGAAWGALTAGLIMATTTFVVGQRCFRIEWESSKMIAIFGLLFASALSLIVLRGMDTPYLVLLSLKAIAVALFIWLGVRLDLLTIENFRLVRDLITRRLKPASGGATP